ncbi:MAG: ComEA family DNA-binding protein [Erysipelotrichaceae bacterium]|nr:ComEA family DNA-binding protein [Erysipelotrichaceae bacterium]
MILVVLIFLLIYLSKLDLKRLDITIFKPSEITVTLRGAVIESGEYKLPAYSTIADLFTIVVLDDNADVSMFNPQTVLKNNDVIDIPIVTAIKLISINTANLDELMTLNGIKEKLAQAIIDHREKYGLFQTLDALMDVKGIGVKKFENIKPYIKL